MPGSSMMVIKKQADIVNKHENALLEGKAMETTDKHAGILAAGTLRSGFRARPFVQLQATIAKKMRRKRFVLFESLISALARPLTVLDVGGVQEFWEWMELIRDDIKVVLYNISPAVSKHSTLISRVGDARDMREFKDKEFQVVFSNSVIEHVGTYQQQHQMADEVQRVGEKYYVQTPNRYFPIEPHFLFPFFQFLPLGFRVFLVTHFNVGWRGRIRDKREALEAVKEIRLLNEKELKQLFPGASIHKEKFLGLTKSFIVYKGWESQ